jgi:hypothetical protein
LGTVGLAGVADTTIKYFERKKEENRLTDIQGAKDDVQKPLPPPNPNDGESLVLYDRAMKDESGAARIAYLNHEVEKSQAIVSGNSKWRTEPASLKEKLALDEAKSNPGIEIMSDRVKDPKYPKEEWAKMNYTHKNPDGSTIEIHYWQNRQSGAQEGHKFKNDPIK